MKTKLFLAILLAFLFIKSFAQYQKLGVEGRSWSTYTQTTFFGNFTNHHKIGKDTLIGNRAFTTIYETDSLGAKPKLKTLLREDTLKPSITYYLRATLTDSVVLDLSVTLGSKQFAFICSLGDSIFYTIDSITNFVDAKNELRNEYHMRLYPTFFGNGERYSWIEGIGSVTPNLVGQGPYMPVCSSDIPIYTVLCVKEADGSFIFNNPNFNGCNIVSVDENPLLANKIYPNPANDFIDISELPLQQIQKITFIHIDGRKSVSIRGFNSGRVDVSNLPSGIYAMQISFRDGEMASLKVSVLR